MSIHDTAAPQRHFTPINRHSRDPWAQAEELFADLTRRVEALERKVGPAHAVSHTFIGQPMQQFPGGPCSQFPGGSGWDVV